MNDFVGAGVEPPKQTAAGLARYNIRIRTVGSRRFPFERRTIFIPLLKTHSTAPQTGVIGRPTLGEQSSQFWVWIKHLFLWFPEIVNCTAGRPPTCYIRLSAAAGDASFLPGFLPVPLRKQPGFRNKPLVLDAS